MAKWKMTQDRVRWVLFDAKQFHGGEYRVVLASSRELYIITPYEKEPVCLHVATFMNSWVPKELRKWLGRKG